MKNNKIPYLLGLLFLLLVGTVNATIVEGDVTGRVEQSSCRVKGYEGQGVLKVSVSADKPGVGIVFIEEGRVTKWKNADVWYYPETGHQRIIFHEGKEGFVQISGKIDAVVGGARPEVSSRGKFHVWNGWRGPCWEEWPLE